MEKFELHKYYDQNNFNPTGFDIETGDAFLDHTAKRNNLYINKLGLPPLIWRGTEVLDVGCGSGENALVPAKLGASLHFIEPLEPSVKRLKELFRKFDVAGSIASINIATLAEAPIERNFDIIIAEGFIHLLDHRKQAVRKLFSHLSPNGFLIMSTEDPTGFFIEYFKGLIANLYCDKLRLTNLDEKVEALRPFFEADFNRIPHSRDFSAFIKDNFFCPAFASYKSFCYGFDELIADLRDLAPGYYSSWPSYKHANDLRWHKDVPSREEELNQALDAYKTRQISFLTGECLPEKEMLDLLSLERSRQIVESVKAVLESILTVFKHKGDKRELIASLEAFEAVSVGTLKDIAAEMIRVLSDLTPASYRECPNLRKFWGVPYHYIVLRR